MTVFARICNLQQTTWTPSQLVSRRLPCTPTSSDPDTWALRDMAFLLSTVLVSGNTAVKSCMEPQHHQPVQAILECDGAHV